MKTKRVIEDRTRNKPGTSFAGFFVVWEESMRPFPHMMYCGHYATRKEAQKMATAKEGGRK